MKVIQINIPKVYVEGHHEIEYGICNGAFIARYSNSSFYCNTTKAIYSTTNDSLEIVSNFVTSCTPPNLECYTFLEFQFPENQPALPEDTFQWLQNRYESRKKLIESFNEFI